MQMVPLCHNSCTQPCDDISLKFFCINNDCRCNVKNNNLVIPYKESILCFSDNCKAKKSFHSFNNNECICEGAISFPFVLESEYGMEATPCSMSTSPRSIFLLEMVAKKQCIRNTTNMAKEHESSTKKKLPTASNRSVRLLRGPLLKYLRRWVIRVKESPVRSLNAIVSASSSHNACLLTPHFVRVDKIDNAVLEFLRSSLKAGIRQFNEYSQIDYAAQANRDRICFTKFWHCSTENLTAADNAETENEQPLDSVVVSTFETENANDFTRVCKKYFV
uniref:Uncharacterized protein n=1 Tax=Glossina pallidipes TaxID=7398 RepID=A0A1B0AGS7_GLOPL